MYPTFAFTNGSPIAAPNLDGKDLPSIVAAFSCRSPKDMIVKVNIKKRC
jgi:hypothetical protein